MMDAKEIKHSARFLALSKGEKALKCAEDTIERLSVIAHKRAQEWERANNDVTYSKSPAHRGRWANIEKQRQGVELELDFFYCASVDWPGLYPTITCKDGKTIYVH